MSCVVAHHIVNFSLVDHVCINCPDQWHERIAQAYKESELNSQDGGEASCGALKANLGDPLVVAVS